MRLKSELWVKAYLRARSAENVMAVLVRRGDVDAGAIFLLIRSGGGRRQLYGPAPAGLDVVDRERRWINCFNHQDVAQEEVDAYLESQLDMDPDIWVIEVEDDHGRHLLDGALMRD